MKLLKKHLLLLLSLIVIASALAITAIAADEATVSDDYSYSLYNPSNNTLTYYTADTSLGTLLTKSIDGAVITLLKDVTETNKATYAGSSSVGSAENKQDIYLDLNGKKLLHAYSSNFTFIEIRGNTSLNVYSSVEGGSILSTTPVPAGDGAYTLFNLRYSGAHLTIGGVEAPVIALDTDESSATYGKYIEMGRRTYSGDNLTTYSGQLVATYYGEVADNQHEDLSFEIIGGTHYKTHASRGGMFFIENDVTARVEGARLHVYENAGSLIAINGKILTRADISFTDSEIYTPSLTTGSSSKFTSSFSGCDIACDEVPSDSTTVNYENCRFTSKSVLTNDFVIKGFRSEKNVSYTEITYNYVDGAIDKSAPYTFADKSKEYVFVTMITDDPVADDIVRIDWIADERTVTEYWVRGEDIIPTPPISETYAEVAAYTFDPIIVSTASSGSTTYTLTPHINFTIKANLALYSDFVYNLYIPKSAADSKSFVSARIDRYGEGGQIISGETLAVKGGETATIKVTDDYSEEYYVLRRSILATEGDSEFRLVITVNGAFDDTFTHIQEFSIFDYAKRVEAGNYADNAKAMVASTVTYIKAARNYAELVKDADATLPYPVEDNPDLEAASGSAVSTEGSALSSEVASVFYGMTLSLEESIKFRFYLYPDTTETVTFSYPVNTKPTSTTITVDDCTPGRLNGIDLVYYDITMRAIDLRRTIEIDLASTGDGVDHTYSLSNYFFKVKGSIDALDSLMDTMFAYSIATNTYLRGETTDTPSVELSIAGERISSESYVIVAGESEAAAADALRLAILAKTGEDLSIVGEAVDGKHSIVFERTSPSLDYDLTVSVVGNGLSVSYGLPSFLENGITSFLEEHVRSVSTDKEFSSGFSDVYHSGTLYYSDFGAAGDGETDDFKAIYDAHAFANLSGKRVKADSGATYYIHNTNVTAGDGTSTAVRTVSIMTDTDWGDAELIIDDSDVNYRDSIGKAMSGTNIFTVKSDYPAISLSASTDERVAALKNIGASYGTTKIDLGLGYPALLVITNSNHKVYRRSGSSYFNSSTGSVQSSNQEEVILVDADGNIDPSTPFMFDYTQLTSITVIRSDVNPITIKGGTVTTIACGLDAAYTVTNSDGTTSSGKFGYFARGLLVNRSYTVVEDVKHHIVGEITPEEHSLYDKQGAHYSGFFYAQDANDVLFKDCVLQGRRYYGISGTYDFGAKRVNKITLDGCIQRNFWLDENDQPSDVDTGITSMKNDTITIGDSSKSVRHCWGIGGTNFCKNMNYWNSRLSRFDAHCGLYNGSIIGCEMTFFSLIGKGDFLIKDTTWYAASTSQTDNYLIYLRGDYGSTWDGELTIENLEAYTLSPSLFKLFFHSYQNWDYGYKCHFPSVEINGFKLYTMAENASDRTLIPAGTTIPFMSFTSEYNLHLDNTLKIAPRRVFKNEDGSYSQTTNVELTGLVNDNPITPPEYIRFLNNEMNYDFTSTIEDYMTKSTFFNGTRISIGTKTNGVITETKVINAGKSEDNTPILPFD